MRATAFVLAALLWAAPSPAQTIRGVVVDETGLVLPGADVTVMRDGAPREHVVAGADGGFDVPMAAGETIVVSLAGFASATVDADHAGRVVLALAHAADEVTVSAAPLLGGVVGVDALGSSLTPDLALHLPMARPKVVESLPLLPSVVRGPDGLLRLDGTRPHEASVLIDGFDLSDPVSGTSSIDLPLEAVRRVVVMRDPMSVAYGSSLGAVAAIDTVAGSEEFTGGVQSFLPHPRLSRSSFGRIDGFFPRAYVSGTWRKRIGYLVAQEYDFERIAVPGITRGGTPMMDATSAMSFWRTDIAVNPRQRLTVEGLVAPARAIRVGMSPLQPVDASPTVSTGEVFVGVTDRLTLSARDVVTIRAGNDQHRNAQVGLGRSEPRLTPRGWRDNSFADTSRRAGRMSAGVDWEHSTDGRAGAHVMLVGLHGEREAMNGTVHHRTVRIEDMQERLLRQIDFGSSAPIVASNGQLQMIADDRWDLNRHWQIESGVRVDVDRHAGAAWAPRLGVRFQPDGEGRTVVKFGAGRFVGRVPLSALGFPTMARRLDTSFDPDTGEIRTMVEQTPIAETLQLPRADSFTVEIERRLAEGLDIQIGARQRIGTALPTVRLTRGYSDARLASDGRSQYRELQLAARRTWGDRGQVFVSYVRSSAHGESNDFATLYGDFEVPHLEPSSWSRTAADVPNRWLVWGTMRLPFQLGLSPAVEMHSGFPYSGLDASRRFVGVVNGDRFPSFFSADTVVYRSMAFRGRSFDLGTQLFNITRHFNPRNVIPVVGTPQTERFLNSVGLRAAGYMVVKWQ